LVSRGAHIHLELALILNVSHFTADRLRESERFIVTLVADKNPPNLLVWRFVEHKWLHAWCRFHLCAQKDTFKMEACSKPGPDLVHTYTYRMLMRFRGMIGVSF
jgi:hypothetical protein